MVKFNKKLFICFLAIFIILSSFFYISKAAPENLKIHFIDVGQADSIFIQLPNNQTMLIDGGNNEDGISIINYIKEIKEQKINTIDYIIGTHPHEDHIGGLDDIIDNFNIGNIYLPRVNHTTKTYEDLLLAIKRKNLKIFTARANTVLFKNKNHDLNFEAIILSPIQAHYNELNNYSLVLKLVYGETSYLFTGDAEKVVERDLVSNQKDLRADVLKVGHHGSESSTTKEFLKSISPEYAVVSVGANNNYGHPSPKIIDRLKKYDIKIFRTDKQGTIIVSSNGEKIKFNKNSLKEDKEKETDKVKVLKTGVYILMVNLDKEEVIIKNEGNSTVDLTNWKLISEKGNQDFIFPEEIKIPPGEKIKVVSGRGAKADPPKIILWNNSYIWNNKGDSAVLYNSNGKVVSRWGKEK